MELHPNSVLNAHRDDIQANFAAYSQASVGGCDWQWHAAMMGWLTVCGCLDGERATQRYQYSKQHSNCAPGG